eukprot:403347389
MFIQSHLDENHQHVLAQTLQHSSYQTLFWNLLVKGPTSHSDMQGTIDGIKLKTIKKISDWTGFNPQSQINILNNGVQSGDGYIKSLLDWRQSYIQTSDYHSRYRNAQIVSLVSLFVLKRNKLRKVFYTFLFANWFFCPGNLSSVINFRYLTPPGTNLQNTDVAQQQQPSESDGQGVIHGLQNSYNQVTNHVQANTDENVMSETQQRQLRLQYEQEMERLRRESNKRP